MNFLPVPLLAEAAAASAQEENEGFFAGLLRGIVGFLSTELGESSTPISEFFQPVLVVLQLAALAAVVITFLCLEWQAWKRRDAGAVADDSGELFLAPPGIGWHFTPEAGRKVYIHIRGLNVYAVYLLKGAHPVSEMDYDSYGQYFTIRCPGGRQTVEQLVVGIFHHNLAAMQHLA